MTSIRIVNHNVELVFTDDGYACRAHGTGSRLRELIGRHVRGRASARYWTLSGPVGLEGHISIWPRRPDPRGYRGESGRWMPGDRPGCLALLRQRGLSRGRRRPSVTAVSGLELCQGLRDSRLLCRSKGDRPINGIYHALTVFAVESTKLALDLTRCVLPYQRRVYERIMPRIVPTITVRERNRITAASLFRVHEEQVYACYTNT